MADLWHDVPIGKDIPKIINAVIEIPKGSKNKYELDKETGFIRVDRVLHSASIYPANYGFIPQTLAEDDDPLDILVLGNTSIHPGCLVYAYPIGVMQMIDEGKIDSKIIAVQPGDPSFYKNNGQLTQELDELPPYTMKEIQRFFEDYKVLENKEVSVEGFQNSTRAKEIIMATNRKYYEEEKNRQKTTMN